MSTPPLSDYINDPTLTETEKDHLKFVLDLPKLKEAKGQDHKKFFKLLEGYRMYKEDYARNTMFDQNKENLGKCHFQFKFSVF